MKTFNTFEEILQEANLENKKIFEVYQNQQALLLEISVETLREKVKKNLEAMKEAISEGLNCKELSASKLTGMDCFNLQMGLEKGASLFSKTHQKALCFSLATAEQNARMGKIVACPTAGSCGIVPSALISSSETLQSCVEEEIDALITAGAVGQIVSRKMALAGAVMGCQGECGVASAMAASSVVCLLKGTNEQIINACALCLKNIMGLTCDPVSGLVEVPCVKRNAFMTLHAFCAAQLAICNIKSQIPADEVVDAMKQTGDLMSPTLRETSQGGLSTTKTGKKITERFKTQWNQC